MNDSFEPHRRATFRAAAKGMRASKIAVRIYRSASARTALDFRGCTKRAIEDAFATGALRHLAGQELRDVLHDCATGNGDPA